MGADKADMGWSTRPIVGFDTETTGIHPLNDRLVTASVIVVPSISAMPIGSAAPEPSSPDPSNTGSAALEPSSIRGSSGSERPENTRTAKNSLIETFYWLADPGVEIPEQSQAVHGISTQQAQREGEPIKKVLNEIAQLLHTHMEQEHPIVAFNASFDLTLLESELARHGLPTLAQRLGRPIGPIIDPYMLDKAVDKYRRGKRNLENMAKFYGVCNNDHFHNAQADVLATLHVLQAIIRTYPALTQESLSALMHKQRTAYDEQAAYFARRAIQRGQEPAEHTGWPVAK